MAQSDKYFTYNYSMFEICNMNTNDLPSQLLPTGLEHLSHHCEDTEKIWIMSLIIK